MASSVGEEWEPPLRLLRFLEGGTVSEGGGGMTRFEVVDGATEVVDGVAVPLFDLVALGFFGSS